MSDPNTTAAAEQIDAKKLRDELATQAGEYYCDMIRKMQHPLCLGSEYKMQHGEFTPSNLDAFREASNLDGKHRGMWEAIKAYDPLVAQQAAELAELRAKVAALAKAAK